MPVTDDSPGRPRKRVPAPRTIVPGRTPKMTFDMRLNRAARRSPPCCSQAACGRRTASAHAGEAPELAALVAAGTLPPLEERLPANPLVVPVVDADRRLQRHLALGDGRRRRRALGLSHGLVREPDALDARLERRDPQHRRVGGRQRQRDRVHLPSSRGHEVVGRRAVHLGRHPVLVRGSLRSTSSSPLPRPSPSSTSTARPSPSR